MLRRFFFGTHRQFAVFLFVLWFLGILTGAGFGYAMGTIQ